MIYAIYGVALPWQELRMIHMLDHLDLFMSHLCKELLFSQEGIPSIMLRTEMSSSTLGQLIPSPFPIIVQLVLSAGEACNSLEKRYPSFVADHPELPLSSAYQMRNAVAHGYFKIDFEIIWKTIHGELPALHKQIRGILAAIEKGAS